MAEEKIYSAILSVMREVEAVQKTKYNTKQNFAYRGIDDVMNALHPLMAKYNVFLIPEVLDIKREERGRQGGGVLICTLCKMRYTLYAEDGSSVSAVVVGKVWTRVTRLLIKLCLLR